MGALDDVWESGEFGPKREVVDVVIMNRFWLPGVDPVMTPFVCGADLVVNGSISSECEVMEQL